jgi:arylsulfatase A-like enzyme
LHKRAGVSGVVALAICLACALSCRSEPSERVRIVLISLDTLRYDQLDPAAESARAMPMTAEWARQGLWFAHFYVSEPLTQPSHASMFTGLQPWEHGVTRNGLILSESLPSVVEQFQNAGFATTAVVASFPLIKRFGFGRGFDQFVETFSQEYIEDHDKWEQRWKVPGGTFFATAEEVTRAAIAQLDGADAGKQFFWFHYFDPHSPYGSSRGEKLVKADIVLESHHNGESVESALARARDGYSADVAYLDVQLDRLLQRLDADSDEYTTHVFVASDHGENFGEDGYLGHGNKLTDEQIHAPAFILSPDIEAGRTDDVASTVDVAKTLLAWADIEVADRRIGGRDLTKAGTGNERAFAMRRTFRSGKIREIGLDGQFHVLDGNLYCEVGSSGRIVRGDQEGVLIRADTTGLDYATRRAIADRFQSFGVRLAETRGAEDLSSETEHALRELGYIE